MAKVQRSFYIEAPIYQKLKVYAALRGVTTSDLINEAIGYFVGVKAQGRDTPHERDSQAQPGG